MVSLNNMSIIANTNHKLLGLYYILLSFFFSISGSLLSLIVRFELLSSGNKYICSENYNIYNLSFTLHGLIMIFFLLMPALFGGFGNYLLPISTLSPEVNFPRINNIALMLLLMSYLCIVICLLSDYGSPVGWTLCRGNEVFKSHSMLETLLFGSVYSCLFICSLILLNKVTITVTRRQSAWLSINYTYSIFMSISDCHQRLNVRHHNFNQWLVGFTDGDGCFHITKDNYLHFQISQHNSNTQLLYYIKNQLGHGTVRFENKTNKVHFKITTPQGLLVIINIFSDYPCLTKKYDSFIKFRNFFILKYPHMKSETKSLNSIQPMSYDWIVGFIEVEGSFYITKKGVDRYYHGFRITQKFDKPKAHPEVSPKPKARPEVSPKQVLIDIANIMKLKVSYVKEINKEHIYLFDTASQTEISKVREFFLNAKMIGIKSLQFRIWERSFIKKDKYDTPSKAKYLRKVQKLLRSPKTEVRPQVG